MKKKLLVSILMVGCYFLTLTKSGASAEKPCMVKRVDTSKTRGAKLYKDARLSSLKKYPACFVSTLSEEDGIPLSFWKLKMQGATTFLATTTKGIVAGYLQCRNYTKTKMKHVTTVQHISGRSSMVIFDLLSMAQAVLQAEGIEIVVWNIADSNTFYKEEAARNNFLLVATMNNFLKDPQGNYDNYLTYCKLLKSKEVPAQPTI